MSKFAPIAIFVYKRPEHTKRLLESLLRCPEIGSTEVQIFQDGPRGAADIEAVAATRQVVNSIFGRSVKIQHADKNFGLAASIISGVSQILSRNDRIIVLEDDLVVSSHFLEYMNEALAFYAKEPKVMQISGYMYPIELKTTRPVFLPIVSSWGWGTWTRAWKCFDPKSSGWESLLNDRALGERFNLGGATDYVSRLRLQSEGLIDSWAIRWYWSVFKANGIVAYPPQSLVANRGMDGTGTHSALISRFFLGSQAPAEVRVGEFDSSINVNEVALEQVVHFLRRMAGPLPVRLMRRVYSSLQRVVQSR